MTNPFPGEHALRVINVSGSDCDVSVSKRGAGVNGHYGEAALVIKGIEHKGAGVIHLASANYSVSVRCGPTRSLGNLTTLLSSASATDIVIVEDKPQSQQSRWTPEHGGRALQMGVTHYAATAELANTRALTPCETQCENGYGECIPNSRNSADSERCSLSKTKCLEKCYGR